MPDHLHLFCAPRDLNFTLDAWVTYWKSQFKKKLNGRVKLPLNPDLKKTSTSVLQSSFYSEADEEFQRQWVRNSQVIAMAKNGASEGSDSLPALIREPSDYRWQEGKPWDTRLRRWENYEQKWRYLRENPVREGLVKNPEDWSYQGMLHVLRW